MKLYKLSNQIYKTLFTKIPKGINFLNKYVQIQP